MVSAKMNGGPAEELVFQGKVLQARLLGFGLGHCLSLTVHPMASPGTKGLRSTHRMP